MVSLRDLRELHSHTSYADSVVLFALHTSVARLIDEVNDVMIMNSESVRKKCGNVLGSTEQNQETFRNISRF
jgi:hypothetical protein